MFFYLLPAALTLGLTLEALLQDQDASLQESHVWLILALVSLLWPITLPSIMWHQCHQRWSKPHNVAH